MPKEILKKHVADLHNALDSLEDSSAGSEEIFKRLSLGIEKLGDDPDVDEQALQQLDDAVKELQAKHPALSEILGGISEALSNLGI